MKIALKPDEALALADEYTKGATFHEGSIGWTAVLVVLAEEVRRLRRGEFICSRCGLRKNGDGVAGDF